MLFECCSRKAEVEHEPQKTRVKKISDTSGRAQREVNHALAGINQLLFCSFLRYSQLCKAVRGTLSLVRGGTPSYYAAEPPA